MAARTAGGSSSPAPSPSTSRTTAGVTTSGPPAPGGRRRTTSRQTAASLASSSATPASSVWARISVRIASLSKRTWPALAAVRHVSPAPAAGDSADNRSNSPAEATWRSSTTAGPSGAAAAVGWRACAAGSGESHSIGPGPSNGRASR